MKNRMHSKIRKTKAICQAQGRGGSSAKGHCAQAVRSGGPVFVGPLCPKEAALFCPQAAAGHDQTLEASLSGLLFRRARPQTEPAAHHDQHSRLPNRGHGLLKDRVNLNSQKLLDVSIVHGERNSHCSRSRVQPVIRRVCLPAGEHVGEIALPPVTGCLSSLWAHA